MKESFECIDFYFCIDMVPFVSVNFFISHDVIAVVAVDCVAFDSPDIWREYDIGMPWVLKREGCL